MTGEPIEWNANAPARRAGRRLAAWGLALMWVTASSGSAWAASKPPPDAGHGAVTGAQRARPDGGPPARDGSDVGSSAPTDAGTALRFGVIGDFGSGDSHESDVARLVKGWTPDFIVTTGDNNYPNGSAATIDDHIGKDYSDYIGDYRGKYGKGSATRRFWPVPGNHDWRTDQLRPYLDYFQLPGNGRYYETDLGLVHLFMLDFDREEPDGNTADSKQARWLKERLAASKSCFNVVVGHQAPYSSGARHGSDPKLQWPFREWGADVVFSGHEHLYERLDVGGLPFIVDGIGGAERYEFVKPLPESKVRYRDDWGAVRVSATGAGITYEFFTVKGERIDQLAVAKRCVH